MAKRMYNYGLEQRMKEYENVTRMHLSRRIPVIVRLDGKAFHTFTGGLHKPFDGIMVMSMQETMKKLCENIQGCVLGYTQSDEITLVITDYATIDTMPWLNYNIRKIVSVSASMATLYFNTLFSQLVDTMYPISLYSSGNSYIDYLRTHRFEALFDSRAFNIPEKDEVCNCLIWRQKDAIRNSIQMVGRANFSHNDLQNKSCKDIKAMLKDKFDIDWDSLDVNLQRGSCAICNKIEKEYDDETYALILSKRRKGDPEPSKTYVSKEWVIDNGIPIFTEDKDYIESRIHFA